MKDAKKSKGQLIAELVESEEKYRIQVEMATDAVFLETIKGRILECNTAGAKMYGYTKEEMIGLTIADLVPKDFVKTLPKIITEKETTHGKFVSRISKKKDGTIFPTEIATKLINIGKKPRLIAYIRDITERKSAEKKRKSLLKKEREQHLKAEILAKVALILTSTLSLSDVLEEVLRQAKRLVPYSACNIVLIKKGGLYNIHSVGYEKYGSEKFVNNFTYPVDKLSLEKEVIKSAKSLLISDTHQDPRWIIFKETSWIRSRLCMPICLGNKVIGLLNLDDDTPGKFVKDDIEKLQPLANAAAVGLENARLFEEVRKEISERKQAEQIIQERENRFRELFKHMRSGVVIYEAKDNGRDFIIKEFNRAAEKIEKVQKEDIIGKSVLKVFPGVKDFGLFKVFQGVYKTGKPQHYPISFYQDQRITGWRENHVYKLPSGEIVAVYDDITERKQAESELQIERDKLTAIFESMVDGVYIVNKDYDIQYVNSVLKKTFGSPEGKKCYEYFHDSDEPCTFCKNEDVFAGKTVRWEWTSPKVGKTYDLIDTPIKNADGSISKLEIFRDITEHKQAEEDLKKNELFLNSILESVQDGISILNPDLTVRHVNGIMNKWYKESLPLEGKKCYEVYHNMNKPCDPCPTLRCLESGKTESNVVPGLPGSPVEWIELYSYPIKDSNSGKITGVVEFVRDITVRKQAEERLKKTMDAIIETVSKIIEAKDPYTAGHQQRVCELAVRIARELNLSEDKIEGIRIASLIHDIGKIGLPTEILSKPTKLTEIEFSLIKNHSQIGYDILKPIKFYYPIEQIVLQHHERMNSSGYPNNLKGDEILLEAKIIGVADIVEAMSSHRPYRPALGIDKALEEIYQNRGTLYDIKVVDACLKLFKEKGFKFK